MKTQTLEQIEEAVHSALAAGTAKADIFEQTLGKQGSLRAFLESLGTKTPEERKELGGKANQLRAKLHSLLQEKTEKVAEKAIDIDWTLPASVQQNPVGVHPISAMIAEMVDIFAGLSVEVVEGKELVSDVNNFENLNMGKDHPARDGHDSFYVTDSLLLRTQTTAEQVLEMQRRLKNKQFPIRVVVPGKTYRRESDQTHSAMFHQIDAVVVDTQTTFADLKGALDYFAKRLFGDSIETRFRPHHFPFTEPSAEMDIKLKKSTGTGKHTGWLEFGGCGMIHPEVLKRAGLNPKIYRGWAFGMSVERPVMLRHQIPDLRLLFSNTPEFLDQFNY